jgi:hypothetical protein
MKRVAENLMLRYTTEVAVTPLVTSFASICAAKVQRDW